MRRFFIPFILLILSTVLFADNRTMVIVKKDGSMIAMHNNDVDSITFSQFDLPEKYYKMGTDTVFVYLFDTIFIHDTLYIENSPTLIDGHEYVDLGLPSGNLWATCNIGAENPEDFGQYFAWGETIGYYDDRIFDWEHYKYGIAYKQHNGTYEYTIYKYNKTPDFGSVDNLSILENLDDAAYINWGKNWRMPTEEDFDELISETNWTFTTINNVSGIKFSHREDHNIFIFLPAAGYRSDNFKGIDKGYYWSSSRSDRYYSPQALFLAFEKTRPIVSTTSRPEGLSVRAVRANKK